MKLAKHITLRHDGTLYIDGQPLDTCLTEDTITVRIHPEGLVTVNLTLMAEEFDHDTRKRNASKTSPPSDLPQIFERTRP